MPRLAYAALLVLVSAALTATVGPVAAGNQPPGKKDKNKGKLKAEESPKDEPAPADSPNTWSTFPASMDTRVREILIDLRGQFNLMDTDINWALDANELARGFRGSKATVPEWGFGINATSEALGKRPKVDDIKKKYPDQYFLNTYDLDRDGKVTKEEFQSGFMTPVVTHYTEVFKQKDKMDEINQKLALRTIDRVQRANLEAQMKILNNQLWAGRQAFSHTLALDSMGARNAQWRANVAWYNAVNRR